MILQAPSSLWVSLTSSSSPSNVNLQVSQRDHITAPQPTNLAATRRTDPADTSGLRTRVNASELDTVLN